MKKIAVKKLILPLSIFLIIVVVVGVYVTLALEVVLPDIRPSIALQTNTYTVPSTTIAWPTYGQEAIGLNSLGVIATSGLQKPAPMASTAKLITALTVLKKYPLSVGETGPLVTITPADVAIYNSYQAVDGSDMVVDSGEQLSEYQMLEAMLLPSADNIADSLAIWAFGSLANYSTYANQYVSENGLSSTHIGIDASGFDPSSTSSASDLVRLGQIVMNNPVLAGIVAKPSVSGLPVVGTISNVNGLLGQDGIVGIKTGNTNQAGGVYVSASKILVNNRPVTIVTATAQAATLFEAMDDSLPLIKSAQANFATPPAIASIKSGSVVGQYIVPWNKQVINAIASQPIPIQSWGGSTIKKSVALNYINVNTKANQVVGSITTNSNLLSYSTDTPILLASNPAKPSNWWKILHPLSDIHF
jgi:D-alanyl-D-alanine carboxypeptidase (penicillin-binding protein 5/6)